MVKHNNSLIKKTFAVVIMITAFVFFSFNTFATTYNPDTYNSYTDSVTYNGLTYYVKVTQLKATSEGTSMLPGGMETIMLVQLQLTNNTNNVLAGTIPKLSIDLRDSGSIITDVYSYGGDFTLGLMSGGTCIFYPSSEFSLDNNKVVVPPNKSLYFVGGIGLPAQLDQTGSSTLDNGLRGVHLYDKSNYSVTSGDYSYGDPIDLSAVIDILDDIELNVDTVLSYLDYEGVAFTPQTSTFSSSLVDITGYSNLTFRSRRDIFPCYYVTEDIEIDAANDVIVQAGSLCYPVCISTYWRNNSTSDYTCRYYIDCQYIFPNTAAVQFVSHDSNYCDYWYENGARMYLFINNADSSNGYMPAKNLGYSATWFNVYVPAGTIPNFGTYNFVPGNIGTVTADDSHAVDIFGLLRNWYSSYKNVNGVDDSSDISNDVADVSDSNHVIEENYYSANASAIQATGLSNYHFTNEQNNGISAVSNDFMLLWNALGSWNGVYIFSLTMALATFIMRHGGLFTVKRKTSDKGGEE